MNNIFGKYKNKNTIVHRLDPRFKIFALIMLMVIVFMNYGNNMNSFLILGIVCVITGILMIISKVSFIDFIKSLKALWLMVILLIIINCFIPNEKYTHPLIVFNNGFTIYTEGLLSAIRVSLRIVLMICFTLILTSTTSSLDLTYAFEWYLTPFKLFKLPTQVVSMTLALALRFIPTLLEEAQKIMKAQKSRGVEYNRGFLVRKVKSVVTLIVPLLVNVFSRSDDLALAMDARGYDPYSKRSRYNSLRFGIKDLISLIVILLVFGFFLFLSIKAGKGFNFLEFLFNVKDTF